ncbi:hypothetical protein E2C01_007912 [Portunus trituberculatus]|uniref:Uncharacterized protein n=1 Tax=Portunus trituberculatus TaxID=210409 RepID=A0A5B7D0D9_PORTR|nr:hypothetical protein [Portunus trituberculatus]
MTRCTLITDSAQASPAYLLICTSNKLLLTRSLPANSDQALLSTKNIRSLFSPSIVARVQGIEASPIYSHVLWWMVDQPSKNSAGHELA